MNKKFIFSMLALTVALSTAMPVFAQQSRNQVANTQTITASTQLGNGYDWLLDVNMGSASQTIYLPQSPYVGQKITIVVDTTNTQNFTLNGSGNLINGSATNAVAGSTGANVTDLVYAANAAGVAGWVQTIGMAYGSSLGATGGVSVVTGTANQISVASGSTTPALTLPSVLILPGTVALKGTSFNTTFQALAAQGQASTITVDDVGASTGYSYTMAAAQTAPGVLSRADMITETGKTVWRSVTGLKNLDGSTLANAASAGEFGVATTATFGSPATLTAVGETAEGATKTDSCEFEVTLPPDYVGGSAINVVVNGLVAGSGTVSTKSLTCDAFLMAAAGTAGSNLGPSAQNLTTSGAAYTFSITPTSLVAGNKLLVQLKTIVTETGGIATVYSNLTDVAVTTSVKM